MHGGVPNAPYLYAETAPLWRIYRNKYDSAPLPWWVSPSLSLCCGAYCIFASGLMATKGSTAPRGSSSASRILLCLYRWYRECYGVYFLYGSHLCLSCNQKWLWGQFKSGWGPDSTAIGTVWMVQVAAGHPGCWDFFKDSFGLVCRSLS